MTPLSNASAPQSVAAAIARVTSQDGRGSVCSASALFPRSPILRVKNSGVYATIGPCTFAVSRKNVQLKLPSSVVIESLSALISMSLSFVRVFPPHLEKHGERL